jgi:hypothetical protein
MADIDLNYMPLNIKDVFEKLSETPFIENYTLVGGTALSLQIRHRLSEYFIAELKKIINSIEMQLPKLAI